MFEILWDFGVDELTIGRSGAWVEGEFPRVGGANHMAFIFASNVA